MFKYNDASGDPLDYQVDGERVLHFGSKIKESLGVPVKPFELAPTYRDPADRSNILNVL